MKLTQELCHGDTREMHINPRYVVIAWPNTCEFVTSDMGEDEYPIKVTRESMNRLIAWMEANC